jgi:hypothetical protein
LKEIIKLEESYYHFYDLYEKLDEEKQKNINSVIESYSRFEIFSQKDLYFDINENRISKKKH